MIIAEFYLKNETFVGFSLKGHAGYGDFGEDIACASVTSAVELTANGITEILKVSANVEVFENEVRLMLSDIESQIAISFIEALRLHLELLKKEFQGRIRINDMEV